MQFQERIITHGPCLLKTFERSRSAADNQKSFGVLLADIYNAFHRLSP